VIIRRLRHAALPAALIAAFVISSGAASSGVDDDRYWAQWRGPRATGVAPQANPPAEWNETTNVRWKKEIPGRSSASPVVWGDRVFLVTAVADDGTAAATAGVNHKFVVMAIDRRTGDTVWERVAREEAPHEGAHRENGTFASGSAVTDGELVIASFESRGFYAYDMDGTLVWEKDLGDKRMRNQFGEGNSPALYGDRLVVNWDHQGQSFIVALDKGTGDELWRRDRDEIAGAGDCRRHESDPELRPRDRRRGLAHRRPDDEPDPDPRRRGRHGLSDERLPRQQPESDPSGRRRR
jgi:outer membrane protein assembly factor BamB